MDQLLAPASSAWTDPDRDCGAGAGAGPEAGAGLRAGAPGPRADARTVGGLLSRRAGSHPRRPCLERAGGDRTESYARVRALADRWSALLDDLGVAPGATVGLALSEPVDFALVFLAVIAAGRVAAPLDPKATGPELTAVCRRVRPRLVLADAERPQRVEVAWLPLPRGSATPEAAGPGRLMEPVGAPGGGAPAADGDGGVILSTSGTTGAPKLIRLHERQLLHTARSVAQAHELSEADRGFNPLPLFHINAEVVGLLATIVAGGTIVLDDRFHREGFWEAVAAHRVTWINAVPAILARLDSLEEGEKVPSSLRFARSASAPLPPAVLERFERTTGVPVVETYGMTEAASQITANPLRGPRKKGSVGIAVGSEVQVRIDACDQRVVPARRLGRVVVRGPGVIRAYAGPGYEDRIDPDGWLDTGDIGFLDDDGYLFLAGRSDDVINRGGEKIHPREIEDVLLSDPEVVAAVVVGREHPRLGEVPVAYLVPASIEGSGAEDLVERAKARCAAGLSRVKWPAAYEVVAGLPRGATGKVWRSRVQEGPAIYSSSVQ